MPSLREVVVTGVGVVSPLGVGREAFWSALLEGRSGVERLGYAGGENFPTPIGAEIKDFAPKKYVKPRKSLKVMCPEIQTGYSAAALAMEDAGLEKGRVPPDRMGVTWGGEMLQSDPFEMADAYKKCVANGVLKPEQWGEGAMSDLYPLWMLKYLPNMAACHVGIAYDARGHNNTLTLEDVSFLLALAEASDVIQRGWTDVVLVGAAGTRTNLVSLLYRGCRDYSKRTDPPSSACRPFDAHRDGSVPGEGAAALVIESRKHAEQRGATALARLAGYSRTFGASPQGPPSVAAAAGRSIQAAMQAANWSPEQVGCIHANGLGEMEMDRWEAEAIAAHLPQTPVTALKSYLGDSGCGSAALETAAAVLALQHGQIPATLNYETPDAECPVNVVSQVRALEQPRILCLNQSRNGQAAAAALESV